MQQRHVFSLFLIWLALCAAAGAGAREASLYEAGVAVSSQSAQDRAQALPKALEQVLIRLGGSRAGALAGQADVPALLQQYRYEQDPRQSRLTLIARFDPDGVQRLLGSATDAGGRGGGAAVRPAQVTVWLAIDDGRGARIVAREAAAAVQPLTQRAAQHGVRLRLPDYDARDQAVIEARDLAAGRAEAVDAAMRRHGGPALMGWMRRVEGGWLAEWRLREGERELGRWQSRDPQAATVLAAGADGVVEALSQREVQVAMSGPAGRYRLVFEQVRSAADYARVMQTLRRQAIVRTLTPLAASGDRLEIEAELGAGVEGLARLLEGAGLRLVSLGDATTASVFALERRG